jgi:PAS domain S-box-containing protein
MRDQFQDLPNIGRLVPTTALASIEETTYAIVHVAARLGLAAAFIAVPLILAWHVRGRTRSRFPRSLWILLALVCTASVVLNLLGIVEVWWSLRTWTIVAEAVFATAAVAGAVMLFRSLPHVLQLRSLSEVNRAQAEREVAEASLEQERYLLHTLMTHLPDAIYFKDIEGRFVRISRGLAERLGLDDPELARGKRDRDFFEPEYAALAERDEQALMRDGQPMVGKLEHPRWPVGTENWVLTTKAPLYDRNGKLVGTFGISHDVTAQKKAELQLAAVTERFELAVRGSTDGLWDWDVRSDRVYYAPRFKELIGYQDHEIQNVFEEWRTRLHPDDLASTLAAINAHLQHRVPYDVEYRLRTKSGAWRWFRARGQALWDETGAATRMSGSITDITDRKQAAEELRASEARYRTLVEHAPEAIVVVGVDEGRFVDANQNAELLFGRSRDQLLTMHPADVSPARQPDGRDSLAAAQEYITQALQGPVTVFDWMHVTSDGVEVPCEVRLVRLPAVDRRLVRASVTDISARKAIEADLRFQISERERAENEVRRQAEHTRRILDTTRDAFVAMNDQGLIVDWNPQAEATFGWTREEVLGRAVADTLVPAELRDLHREGLRRFLESGEGPVLDRRIEVPAVHRDGHRFPIELTITALPDDHRYFFAAFLHDISARKRAEAELQQAKEQAEAASRSKSDFLANMSHEIRTPMNAVIGMTELVLDSKLTATQRDYLNTVLESSESLLTIINEILDFSKIEAGRLDLSAAPFLLRDEIGDALKPFGVRAASKELELAWRVDDEVPDGLIGDAGRLRQVLVNLVGNAIKFTAEGEVVVDVGLESRQNGEVCVHVRVQDTGVGIPMERQRAIFDAFEQADTSTTRRYGGTGLGLTIAQRIVERMQGRIWVESCEGQGSTFHFTVPLQVAAELPERPTAPDSLSGLPVLIVDDNATNRAILAETLRRWGLEVLIADSAAAALSLLDRHCGAGGPLPLLITDVQMPNVDGYELIERIRGRDDCRTMPVIVLTSGTRTGDAARHAGLAVEASLIKPIKQSELLNAVLRAASLAGPDTETTGEAQPQPSLRPLRILLAEDGRANQKLAVALLSAWGHSVAIAENGRTAIEAWEAEPFDLVLMDVQMPELDGLAATREIRAREASTGRHTLIIAMTARAMTGDRELCLAAGMDGYVSKPVRKRQLYAVIAPYFAETATTMERPTPVSEPEADVSASAAEPGEALPVIDWNSALRTVGQDRALLAEIIQESLAELPSLVQQLESHAASGDAAAAARTAHTIKGTGRAFGAARLMHLARRIEEWTAADGTDSILGQLPGLRSAADDLCDALREFKPA